MYFVFDGKEARITKDCSFQKMVGTIKIDIDIHVTYFKVFLSEKKNFKNSPLFSLLKSNLQKQIRRGEKEAVTTAEVMLGMNEFELLRRLSIIAGEDVILSKETSIIVWYMCAVSKGYILSPVDKEFILSYILSLTHYPICRRLEIKKLDLNSELNLFDILDSNHPDKEILTGILFRRYFGGLAGDLPMMSRLCDDFLISTNRLETLPVYEREKYPLKINNASIDFHIYPKIITLISNDTKLDPDLIKKTIWECSSRINFRFNEVTELNEVWEKILPSFSYHSKTYLSKF